MIEVSAASALEAAARYLGVRGDRLSMNRLRRALGRREVARHATRALGDAGPLGLEGLAEALRDPELADLALAHIRAVGGAEAAGVLGEALHDFPESRREPLLEALGETGPAGAERLLRLAERDALTETELVQALERIPAAGEAVGAVCAGRASEFEERVLLAAVGGLHPPAALPWLEELCLRRDTRAAAVTCLAGAPGLEALAAMFRLHVSSRVPRDLLEPAAAAMVGADPERNVALARELLQNEQYERALELLELLVLTDRSAAVPALVLLARERSLPEDPRQWAALAAGEMGAPEHAELLSAALPALGAQARRLAAAHLIAIAQLAGEDAALDALGPVPDAVEGRVRRLLRRVAQKGDPSVSLFTLAREIEPYLGPGEGADSPL